MAKKGKIVDTKALAHANLAVIAEQAGNFEDAAKYWQEASDASLNPNTRILYGEAAKRCDRKSKA